MLGLDWFRTNDKLPRQSSTKRRVCKSMTFYCLRHTAPAPTLSTIHNSRLARPPPSQVTQQLCLQIKRKIGRVVVVPSALESLLLIGIIIRAADQMMKQRKMKAKKSPVGIIIASTGSRFWWSSSAVAWQWYLNNQKEHFRLNRVSF